MKEVLFNWKGITLGIFLFRINQFITVIKVLNSIFFNAATPVSQFGGPILKICEVS